MQDLKRTCGAVVAMVVLAFMPTTASAVDGVILIDQAKAITGGVTPGDTPGFPITISAPGSYRLDGNLVVPNANTNAIVITASHVTIDLNGFSILGPTDCSGGLQPCAGVGSGNGIITPAFTANVTVRNGTIQGMGSAGVRLVGDEHVVEHMHVRSNGDGGIRIFASQDQAGSLIHHNTVQRNGESTQDSFAAGIDVDRGLVSDNVVSVNVIGISIGSGNVSRNFVERNSGVGLNIGGRVGYFDNVFIDNFGGAFDAQVSGSGVNAHNMCANVPCP